jgi:hypothetical protein
MGAGIATELVVAAPKVLHEGVIVRGHAFMKNLRGGHYELGVEAQAHRRVADAFTELAGVI